MELERVWLCQKRGESRGIGGDEGMQERRWSKRRGGGWKRPRSAHAPTAAVLMTSLRVAKSRTCAAAVGASRWSGSVAWGVGRIKEGSTLPTIEDFRLTSWYAATDAGESPTCSSTFAWETDLTSSTLAGENLTSLTFTGESLKASTLRLDHFYIHSFDQKFDLELNAPWLRIAFSG